jgi:hypothetical protein
VLLVHAPFPALADLAGDEQDREPAERGEVRELDEPVARVGEGRVHQAFAADKR